ncbi:related to Tuftelin-interacting protein 11 [Rhynchosporium graminicola]|uniref:Related to Tuftelin-interacting protein 11 n=1 Tax=Rhynchosporium graminicola TaxID=2792576 RepID=A0A1E1L0Y6_9HELO|nr:related to Tuftelin-interacting protein 11 [Rhynchosporium commune]
MSSMHAFATNSSSDSSEEETDFLHPSTDPRADEFADYNPRKRRRTGRDAKESAALGVFGSESEDEGYRPGKSWNSKGEGRGEGRSLRAKRMSFVKTGEKPKRDSEDEDEDDEEEEYAEAGQEEDREMVDADAQEEAAAPRGLGFAPSKSKGLGIGMGYQSPAPRKQTFTSANSTSAAGTPLGRGFVPSSAAVPILLDEFEDEVTTPRISRPSAFSTPTTNENGRGGGGGGRQKGQLAPGVNVSSFAARMMAKMGYKEGDGLGKEGQGRSNVIEVTLRPQGVGLGAVKEKSKQEIEEEKRQAKIKGVKYEGDSDEELKKKRRKKSGFGGGLESGSGSGMSTPRKTAKPKFRTLEEVQKAAPGLQIPEAFAPILDMRAPGQRLLTTASGLLTPTAGGFETAEQTESKKLARRAQNDLSAYVEEWKNLEERKAYVEMVIVQQQQDMDEEQREYDRMKSFADTVQAIEQAVSELQWDPVIEALIAADKSSLADEGSERVSEELNNIAVAAVYPFLRQAVEGWQPLTDPKLNGLAPQLFKIRHILGASSPSSSKSTTLASQNYMKNDGSHRIHSKSTTTYESMIYKLIFPKIVSSITSTWNVHSPSSLLTLLQTWDGLLPSFVRSQIFDQSIVSKLNTAVSSWNPKKRREKELPHLWLFPWLQYLPSHQSDPSSSTGLVSDIKRKFRSLISTWDFRKGVIPGLEQWKIVLQPNAGNDHWTSLLMNHVLPTMARFLRNPEYFMVDPQDQSPYMSTLEGVLAWKEILGKKMLAQILVETIFPMWMGVLHQWLTIVGPNEEIGVWFEWWRDDVFPEDIKNLPAIREEFEKGHRMIEHALDLGDNVGSDLPLPLPSTSTSTQSQQAPLPSTPAPAPAPSKVTPPAQAEEPTTFRHRVEDWCIDNDLQFLPEKKVLHSAGPLYRITAAGNGKNGTLAYFRGDSLTALVKKAGETVELRIMWENEGARDALLEMAWQGVK